MNLLLNLLYLFFDRLYRSLHEIHTISSLSLSLPFFFQLISQVLQFILPCFYKLT